MSLGCAVADEQEFLAVQESAVASAIQYKWLRRHKRGKREVVDGCVDFHAACVNHRCEQCAVGDFCIGGEHGCCGQQLQGVYADKRDTKGIGQSLCFGKSDTQSGVASWTYGNCDCVQAHVIVGT